MTKRAAGKRTKESGSRANDSTKYTACIAYYVTPAMKVAMRTVAKSEGVKFSDYLRERDRKFLAKMRVDVKEKA